MESNNPSVKYISDGYGMTFIATDKKISSISYPVNIIYRFCLFLSATSFVLFIIFILRLSFIHRKAKLHKLVNFLRGL